MNRVALFAVLLIFATTASGRLIRAWTYQELTAASDLVLIATPTATADTKEEAGLPGMASVRVTGVDTHFTVLTVLKGDAKLKDITVHHYRVTKGVVVDNGPMLVKFDPTDHRSFLLFLIREADGRYAPAGGQTDPADHSVHVLNR